MNVSDSCAYMCHLRVHAHIPNLCMCVHMCLHMDIVRMC